MNGLNQIFKTTKRQICLMLGSNIEPHANLPAAFERLCQELEVTAASQAWASPPHGAAGPDFLNAALLVQTDLSIERLKAEILRPIEAALGRVRTEDRNAPRTIDIDIVVDQDIVLDPELWRCAYLAVPVAELLPDLCRPNTGTSLVQLSKWLARETNIQPDTDVLFHK